MSNMGELFISCVGDQPGAIATAVKTRAQRIDDSISVLLLATQKTKPSAERLKRWIEVAGLASVEAIRLVNTAFDDIGELPSTGAALRVYLGQLEHRPQIVFYANPGRKAMVLSALAALYDLDEPFVRVHADIARLYLFGENGSDILAKAPLADIGCDALFRLHDLELAGQPLSPHYKAFPEAVRKAIRSTGAGGAYRCLEPPEGTGWLVVHERRGSLYCLAGPLPRDQQTKDQRDKGAAAVARSIMHVTQHFPGLRPHLTACAPGTGPVYQHLGMGRVRVINTGRSKRAADDDRLRRWFRGEVHHPAETVPQTETSRVRGVPALGSMEDADASTADVLVEFLGLDVSANLISLATHRERRGVERAVILCDLATKQIEENAKRLRDALPGLGYKAAVFIPVDVLGQALPVRLDPDAERWEGLDFHVDVTPGTKAQACQLMSTLGRVATLWSVDGARGVARELGGSRAVALAGPQIATWARVAGGELQSGGREIGEPDRFCEALLPLLGEESGGDVASLGEWKSAALAAERRRGNLRLSSHRNVLSVRTAEGNWVRQPDRQKDGDLFEHLVATAFLNLVQPPDEVRLNIKWAWDEDTRRKWAAEHNRPENAIMRCELDVVARFSHRLLCVSCKSYAGNAYARKEIETVASKGFGRLAIPVLASFRCEDPEKKAASRKRGAVLIDREELSSPQRLEATLDKVIASRMAGS